MTDDAPSPSAPRDAGRPAISEDWLATITGLALILLVLAGVIGSGMVP